MNQKGTITLIQEILNGSKEAENKFYSICYKHVEDYMKYNYSSIYDVEDDISEILIKLFANLFKYNSELSQFKSWVNNITKNHMIDKWRASGTTVTTSLSDMDVNSGFTNSSANTTAIDVSFAVSTTTNNLGITTNICGSYEVNDTVNYITSELSSCDYTLLNMKYVQGYSYDEIGCEFNLSSSTVSNKVNYIKSKIKKDYCEFYVD